MKSNVKIIPNEFSFGMYESQSLEHNPRSLAINLGADPNKICFAKPASDEKSPGFQVVTPATYGDLEKSSPDVEADCVKLSEPNSAAIFRLGDCPAVFGFERTSKTAILIHCGRPSLTPTAQKRHEMKNIIQLACEEWLRCIKNPIVHVHISSCVCPEHFAHETPEGQEMVKSFDQFGEHAFTDRATGKLDLREIIKRQFCSLVRGELYFSEFEECTYETPWLASHRRHPTEKLRSPVVVVLH